MPNGIDNRDANQVGDQAASSGAAQVAADRALLALALVKLLADTDWKRLVGARPANEVGHDVEVVDHVLLDQDLPLFLPSLLIQFVRELLPVLGRIVLLDPLEALLHPLRQKRFGVHLVVPQPAVLARLPP